MCNTQVQWTYLYLCIFYPWSKKLRSVLWRSVCHAIDCLLISSPSLLALLAVDWGRPLLLVADRGRPLLLVADSGWPLLLVADRGRLLLIRRLIRSSSCFRDCREHAMNNVLATYCSTHSNCNSKYVRYMEHTVTATASIYGTWNTQWLQQQVYTVHGTHSDCKSKCNSKYIRYMEHTVTATASAKASIYGT